MPMTIQEFVDSQQGHTGLHWVAGRSGASRTVGEPDRNTVDQVGYLNLIHPRRLSVFGPDEIAYFNRGASEHTKPYVIPETGHVWVSNSRGFWVLELEPQVREHLATPLAAG